MDGREYGLDLARFLLVHGHGHLESAPPPAKAVHHLEAAHVGAHEQGTAALVCLCEYLGLAFECDVEYPELLVDQIDAIVDGGGKAQYLTKAVARAGAPAEREAQVASRMAPRVRCEQKEIDRDSIQGNSAQSSAQMQGNERHDAEQCDAAPLAMPDPIRLGSGVRDVRRLGGHAPPLDR